MLLPSISDLITEASRSPPLSRMEWICMDFDFRGRRRGGRKELRDDVRDREGEKVTLRERESKRRAHGWVGHCFVLSVRCDKYMVYDCTQKAHIFFLPPG